MHLLVGALHFFFDRADATLSVNNAIKERGAVAVPDAIGVRDARFVPGIEVGWQGVLGEPAHPADLIRV